LIRLVCGGDVREVDLRETPEGLVAVVDGRPIPVDVQPAGPGTFLWREGDRVETFHCVRDGDLVHLSWRGAAYRLEEDSESSRSAHRAVPGALEAPMPGRVIAVRIAPGQSVTKGQELLVVEAMKMENALRAPRDGVVKAVAAAVGDMVSPGAVLVELE